MLLIAACSPPANETPSQEASTEPTATENVVHDATPKPTATEDLVPDPTPEPTAEPESITNTIFIGAEEFDCEGVAPRKCLLIKKNIDDDYLFFFNHIEGFEWETGFECELLVKVIQVLNPSVDASSLLYTLVEVVSSSPTATE